MSTQELIERTEALADRISEAINETGYVALWPQFCQDITPAEISAMAAHFGTDVQVSGTKFQIRINRRDVNIYAETAYNSVPRRAHDAAELLAAAMEVKETPAAA